MDFIQSQGLGLCINSSRLMSWAYNPYFSWVQIIHLILLSHKLGSWSTLLPTSLMGPWPTLILTRGMEAHEINIKPIISSQRLKIHGSCYFSYFFIDGLAQLKVKIYINLIWKGRFSITRYSSFFGPQCH